MLNLAAGRYKPQVAERPPEEDPAELTVKCSPLSARSSLVWRNFARDRSMTAVTEQLLDEMVQVIVREIDPEQVYLFGSRARGDARRLGRGSISCRKGAAE